MKNLLKIAQGVDVTPLLLQIQRQPNLWNRHGLRLKRENSPHRDASDIWLRYNDIKPYDLVGDYEGINDEHESKFYPEWYALPAARSIVMGLLARVEGTRLGGVLVTKIPAGKCIFPHVDRGWHPEYYNTKLYVVLQSNPQCVNRVEDEQVAMVPGEVWFFDNTKEHEVQNNGPEDRITLIICARCEK